MVVHLPPQQGRPGRQGGGTSHCRACAAPTKLPAKPARVRALEAWLRRAKIRRGPVFRSVTAHGTLEERLTGAGVRHILLSRAKLAKLTVHASERLSPHGFARGLDHRGIPRRRTRRAGGGTHAARRPLDDARLPQAGRASPETTRPACSTSEHDGQACAPDGERPGRAGGFRRSRGCQSRRTGWSRLATEPADGERTCRRGGALPRRRARGTGGVPWHFDLDQEEARLFAPMASAGPEARMLGAGSSAR